MSGAGEGQSSRGVYPISPAWGERGRRARAEGAAEATLLRGSSSTGWLAAGGEARENKAGSPCHACVGKKKLASGDATALGMAAKT